MSTIDWATAMRGRFTAEERRDRASARIELSLLLCPVVPDPEPTAPREPDADRYSKPAAVRYVAPHACASCDAAPPPRAGWRCPACRSADVYVKDSRQTDDRIRRRRVCRTCGHRYTTSEIVADDP